MEEVVNKAIELLQQAAPELWRMARQQVYVAELESIFWLVVCALISIVSVIVFIKAFRVLQEYDEYSNEFAFGIVGAIFSGLIFVVAISSAFVNASMLFNLSMNPDYFAVQNIIRMVK